MADLDLQKTPETQKKPDAMLKDNSKDFGVNQKMIEKIFADKPLGQKHNEFEIKYTQLDENQKKQIQANINTLDPELDDIGAYKDTFHHFFENGSKNGGEEMKKKLDESNAKKKQTVNEKKKEDQEIKQTVNNLDQSINSGKQTVNEKKKEDQEIKQTVNEKEEISRIEKEKIEKDFKKALTISEKYQVENLPTYTFTNEQKQKLQTLNISEEKFSKIVYLHANPSLITDQKDKTDFEQSYKNINEYIGEPHISPTLSSFSNPETVKQLSKNTDNPTLSNYLKKENQLTLPTSNLEASQNELIQIQNTLNTEINALKISEFSSVFGKTIGEKNMALLNLNPTDLGANFSSNININGNDGKLNITPDGQLVLQSPGLRTTNLGNMPSMQTFEQAMNPDFINTTLSELPPLKNPQEIGTFIDQAKNKIALGYKEKIKNLIPQQPNLNLERALTKLSVKNEVYEPLTKQGIGYEQFDQATEHTPLKNFYDLTNNTLNYCSQNEMKIYTDSLNALSTFINNKELIQKHPLKELLTTFETPAFQHTDLKPEQKIEKRLSTINFLSSFSKQEPNSTRQIIDTYQLQKFVKNLQLLEGKTPDEAQKNLIKNYPPKIAQANEKYTEPPYNLENELDKIPLTA